jgi:hypothetical protein
MRVLVEAISLEQRGINSCKDLSAATQAASTPYTLHLHITTINLISCKRRGPLSLLFIFTAYTHPVIALTDVGPILLWKESPYRPGRTGRFAGYLYLIPTRCFLIRLLFRKKRILNLKVVILSSPSL